MPTDPRAPQGAREPEPTCDTCGAPRHQHYGRMEFCHPEGLHGETSTLYTPAPHGEPREDEYPDGQWADLQRWERHGEPRRPPIGRGGSLMSEDELTGAVTRAHGEPPRPERCQAVSRMAQCRLPRGHVGYHEVGGLRWSTDARHGDASDPTWVATPSAPPAPSGETLEGLRDEIAEAIDQHIFMDSSGWRINGASLRLTADRILALVRPVLERAESRAGLWADRAHSLARERDEAEEAIEEVARERDAERAAREQAEARADAWQHVAAYYLGDYADEHTPEECRREAVRRSIAEQPAVARAKTAEAALTEAEPLLRAARTALDTGDHLYPAWVHRTDEWLAAHRASGEGGTDAP